MNRILDHIDLRVKRLDDCREFYRGLLPLLGFTELVEIPGWLQFEAPGSGPAQFFGVTEDPTHQPNRSRIAFWAERKAAVDELALKLPQIGARNIEGPEYVGEHYYAVYFEDPTGNALEICHRTQRFNPSNSG